jgi:hypothetical protein
MRTETIICDRCGSSPSEDNNGWMRLRDYRDGSVDLCAPCYGAMREWIKATP